MDICHDNPPFLNGYSEIFKRCKLWMSDSDAFMGPEAAGKLARVVGKIKRKGTADAGVTPINLEVLSIQEHSWTDVAEQYLGITGLVLH